MADITKYEITEDDGTFTVSDGERSFQVGPDGEPLTTDWFVSDAEMTEIKKTILGD